MSLKRICDKCGYTFDDVDTYFIIKVERRSFDFKDDKRFEHYEELCETCISSLTLYGFNPLDIQERNIREYNKRKEND